MHWHSNKEFYSLRNQKFTAIRPEAARAQRLGRGRKCKQQLHRIRDDVYDRELKKLQGTWKMMLKLPPEALMKNLLKVPDRSFRPLHLTM